MILIFNFRITGERKRGEVMDTYALVGVILTFIIGLVGLIGGLYLYQKVE